MKTSINRYALLGLMLGVLPVTLMAQQPKISNWRPYDQTGINMFETRKSDSVPFKDVSVRFGAGFTQQFQGLKHTNTALNNTGTGANRLYPLKPGFMTAQANLFIDAQLGEGISLNVTNYMSARHHNEFWVKGGYIQFDKVPFKGKFWKGFMDLATIKIGHFEVNYGDQHFRRSDGGQTLWNPFMEGYIMDAFATEIGGEIYFQKNGFIGMIGMTNGMIKGHVDSVLATTQDANTKRNPSLILKAGYDKQLNEKVRVRFTGSLYSNNSQAGSGITLYSGDRTGSNYQNIMEKGVPGALPASTTMYASGRFNPGFSKKITATMLNGFLKYEGFELFGTYESAKGRSKTETAERKASQYGIDGIYRFGAKEDVYLGVRYNGVTARLAGYTEDVKLNRFAIAGGWFLTKSVLLKAEYVNQNYDGFLNTDFRNGGNFKGYVIEAVVGF